MTETSSASAPPPPATGTIGWVDLTVPNAEQVRDFYRAVAGWRAEHVEMGGYSDFTMFAPEGSVPVAGVCHARGTNADLPPQWLIYITVDDLDASIARCVELGGQVISGPKRMGGHAGFCVIQDPAGAVAALYAPAR
jgi:predicted enzyme related to lactoylglutathione lyase